MGCRVTLGDICDINTSQYSTKEAWPRIQYLDTGNVTRGVISELQQLDPLIDKVPSRARRKVKPNSIVYSMVRPNQGHYALLKNPPVDMLVSTGFSVINADESQVLPSYLYYALTTKGATEGFQALAEQSVSTYPTLSSADLLAFEVVLPPLKCQQQVAAVLERIDEKIAVNAQLNGYLAEMAETIAAKYCEQGSIRLRDICHQVVERVDCEEAELGAYVSTESLLQDKKGRQPAASLPATGKVTRFVVGDTLISNIRPYFKKVWYASFDGTCSSDVLVLRANAANDAPYIHACLRQDSFFGHVMRGAKGTKMPRGDKKQMMEFCIAPTCEPGDLSVLSASLKQISLNDAESARLAALRDYLLPKLMSGEIDVSQIDKLTLSS